MSDIPMEAVLRKISEHGADKITITMTLMQLSTIIGLMDVVNSMSGSKMYQDQIDKLERCFQAQGGSHDITAKDLTSSLVKESLYDQFGNGQ